MKKSILKLFLVVVSALFLLIPTTAFAKNPEIMNALKSHVQVYGPITWKSGSGGNSYVSKISYLKKGKKFLFRCDYSNGRSTSSVKMYVPATKKKNSYTVNFSQVVRAKGKTAKMSGKATLKRKTYSNLSSTLKFSRKNRTSSAKKIKNAAYQNAANAMLRASVSMWEQSLERTTTLCLPNFGFRNVATFDKSLYAYEW